MEQYQTYKGYGITYYELFGTTVINNSIGNIKEFIGLGIIGIDEAKKYIDNLTTKSN